MMLHPEVCVSDLDKKALDSNFAVWKEERAADLAEDKAFERFCFEQVLKDSDLSDEDLDFGDFGGVDDGGVDAMYLFMNTGLVTEETELPDPTTSVELVLIQATRESSFTEERIEKIHTFARDLLDYSKPPDKITYLNSDAQKAIKHFRDRYDKVLGFAHTLKISFHYTCKSVTAPNNKVEKRIENLKAFVKSRLSAASVMVKTWGSADLLATARRIPNQKEIIPITTHMATSDGSVVCLVRLNDFAAFLKDSNGNMKTRMLEPNVRDYQGRRNPVNAQIRETLTNQASTEEFWWLNNGITILAKDASITGSKLTVDTPEIVNGLQTSHEIFTAFGSSPWIDARNVLVRIILPKEEQSRNLIIKATNSQTPVETLSLRATDRIHLDIEDRLKAYGLFYDRRKGEHRRLRKTISKIVSVRELAQACIAVLLQEPDNARARPQTVLKDDDKYGLLFDEANNRDVYAACILLDRQVATFLLLGTHYSREIRRDIRYYVDMVVSCALTGKAKPTAAELASVVSLCVNPISDGSLNDASEIVYETFEELGGTDTIAKSVTLRNALLDLLRSKYPNQTGSVSA